MYTAIKINQNYINLLLTLIWYIYFIAWLYSSWIYIYLCSQFLSLLMFGSCPWWSIHSLVFCCVCHWHYTNKICLHSLTQFTRDRTRYNSNNENSDWLITDTFSLRSNLQRCVTSLYTRFRGQNLKDTFPMGSNLQWCVTSLYTRFRGQNSPDFS